MLLVRKPYIEAGMTAMMHIKLDELISVNIFYSIEFKFVLESPDRVLIGELYAQRL